MTESPMSNPRGHGWLALFLATAVSATAQNPETDAVAFWHLGDTNDGAGGNSALTIQGNVRLGVPLEGEEHAASLARHGDGRVAVFEGGWLSVGQGLAGKLNVQGKSLTVALRLRDPSGTRLSSGVALLHDRLQEPPPKTTAPHPTGWGRPV